MTGCAQTPEPSDGTPYAVRGYWFHDSMHPNTVVSPSPQAIDNANHGVWLWPPKQSTRAG